MKILLDNNAVDKLAQNLDLIKFHPEIEFYICKEAVEEVSNNKTYNPTYNVIALLKVGVSYLPNAVFILGHSLLDGQSTFSNALSADVYKNVLNENGSNIADAIIAATAVANNCVLLTDDKRLITKMQLNGYPVMTFKDLENYIINNSN